MGCVLGNNKLEEVSEFIYSIHNSKDAIALSDDRLYTNFKQNFIIKIHTILTECVYKSLKESLQHQYKSLEYKTNSKENYTIKVNYKDNCISTEISYKMLKEIINFIHFTSKNFARKLKSEFIFKNCLFTYRNIISDYTFKYSLILISDFQMGFVKDFCLKFQFETFLFFDKNEVDLLKILKLIIKDIEDADYLNKYKGLILPPIEYENDEDFEYILNQTSNKNINFIEIQLKINLSNFHSLKGIFNVFLKHLTSFENLCLTMMFYNMKGQNVNKISDLILNMLQEVLQNYFSNEENSQKVFLLKLFFIIYENNCVDYKYYVFREKSKKMKKGGIRSNSLILQDTHTKTNARPFIPADVLLLNEKLKIRNLLTENKKKVLKIISQFIYDNDSLSFSLLGRNKMTSNSFSNTQLEASIMNTSNESKNGSRTLDYLFETQTRHFILEDRSSLDNFNVDYNEKFLEYYKVS